MTLEPVAKMLTINNDTHFEVPHTHPCVSGYYRNDNVRTNARIKPAIRTIVRAAVIEN